MRLLKALVLMSVLAVLAAGCGGGSSSHPSSGSGSPTGPAPSGRALQLRPVYAHYATGVPLGGPQLGPAVPAALLTTMKNFDCSSGPQELQGMLMTCDADRTVFLLKDPIVTGGVAKAVAAPIHGEKLWVIKVTLDSRAAAILSQAADTMVGTELALVSGGHVVNAQIVDAKMKDGMLVATGNYNQKQSEALAARLSKN